MNAARILVCLLVLGLLVPAARADAQAAEEPDAIYLTTGAVVRGTVVDDAPGAKTVVLRTKDGNYFRYQRSEILRIVRGANHAAGDTTPRVRVTPRARKSPPLAWFMSFAAPGSGQAYNGQWKKTGVFASMLGLGAVMYLGAKHDCEVYQFECGIRGAGVVLAVGAWTGSQVDAVFSAVAINRQRAVDIQIGITPHRLGVSLASIRF